MFYQGTLSGEKKTVTTYWEIIVAHAKSIRLRSVAGKEGNSSAICSIYRLNAFKTKRAGMGNYPISGTTDIRSDIFGLGACCYAMLTGKPPSEGVGLSELFEDIRSGEPALPQLAHLAVNEQFQAIVMRMISKNANNRYQTPKELLKELGQVGRLSGLDF